VRQRNTSGADLLVQGEPPFMLAAGAEVDYPIHIIGCEQVADTEPEPTESPAEVAKLPRRGARTEVTEGGAL
jgi:hypothetical protein